MVSGLVGWVYYARASIPLLLPAVIAIYPKDQIYRTPYSTRARTRTGTAVL